MTAEIAVMNKHGVALAADSAVTVGAGAKIYASVNKIFALSKYRPVGVMIYGSAELMNVPWETVIKTYRRQLGDRRFDTLAEYAIDFVNYLGGCRDFFPGDEQRRAYHESVREYFTGAIRKEVRSQVQEHIDQHGSIADREIEALLDSVVERHWRAWDASADMPLVPANHEQGIRDLYEVTISKAQREAFEKMPVSDTAAERLMHIAVMLAAKLPPPEVQIQTLTGLVVAGFGESEYFPSLIGFEVDSVVNDSLICWVERNNVISREVGAFVSAFAQGEMVHRFMEGIDPDYQNTIHESLDAVLSGYTGEAIKIIGKSKVTPKARREIQALRDQLLEDYVNGLAEHRSTTYVRNVTQAVASLPIGELAEMAESLVNLTSLKRKVSMQTESVGGPIDVALITPGDGFIWIKRKHYFMPDRNPQFFANYYKDD